MSGNNVEEGYHFLLRYAFLLRPFGFAINYGSTRIKTINTYADLNDAFDTFNLSFTKFSLNTKLNVSCYSDNKMYIKRIILFRCQSFLFFNFFLIYKILKYIVLKNLRLNLQYI